MTAFAMRAVAAWLCCLAAPLAAVAAESTIELDPMTPNLEDKPSLQRGMALFMNYCIGCHSLKFQRYERTADDLGIPHKVALENLVFTDQADRRPDGNGHGTGERQELVRRGPPRISPWSTA